MVSLCSAPSWYGNRQSLATEITNNSLRLYTVQFAVRNTPFAIYYTVVTDISNSLYFECETAVV